MIVEYIRYRLAGSTTDDVAEKFEAAYAKAAASLDASVHCLGYELSRCVEERDRYILRIDWDSMDGHLRDFRHAPEFAPFLDAIRPYISQIEEMQHYEATSVVARRWSARPRLAPDADRHQNAGVLHQPRRAMSELVIAPLDASPALCTELAGILVDVVAHNGSVSFMHPLSSDAAHAFWERALTAAGRGERIVLGARIDGILAGTVTLLLDFPPNQPHRGEIAKLMTRPAYRGRGIAVALVREAERLAIEHGRTLLVLDTATDGGASDLYENLGFTLTGEIPDFALTPFGVLTGTRIYWKRIGATSADIGAVA